MSETRDGEEHAFLWDDGEMYDLGTLGGQWSWANLINNRGLVAGLSADAAGRSTIVLWSNGNIRDTGLSEYMDVTVNFAYKSEQHAMLAPLEDVEFEPLANGYLTITELGEGGQLFGEIAAGGDTSLSDLIILGYVWDNGRLAIMKCLPRKTTRDGHVYGYRMYSSRGAPVESVELLGFPTARFVENMFSYSILSKAVVGINDFGQKISNDGMVFFTTASTELPDGDDVELGLLDEGHRFSVAMSINNAGQIAGWSGPDPIERFADPYALGAPPTAVRPFVWASSMMKSLDSLAHDHCNFLDPFVGVCDDTAFPELLINENGQVAGTLVTKDEYLHAFILL